MLEKFTILNNATEGEILALYSLGAKGVQTNTLFTDLKGWREESVEVETVPALFTVGSFVKSMHQPERTIELDIMLKRSALSAALAPVNTFRNLIRSGTLVRLVLTSEASLTQEVIIARVISVGEVETLGVNTATMRVKFLSVAGQQLEVLTYTP